MEDTPKGFGSRRVERPDDGPGQRRSSMCSAGAGVIAPPGKAELGKCDPAMVAARLSLLGARPSLSELLFLCLSLLPPCGSAEGA